ncbi:MAG: TerC family protein [Rickettsiales bacterium]|nr:TerC family protein [Rickettsiales bacterium]
MELFVGYDLIFSLATLTFLEIILGIDNLIFISLVTYKLPKKSRNKARVFGLSLALVIRVLMLLTLSWIMTLTEPLFYLAGHAFSFKNFLLISGGLFLIVKSSYEIVQDVFFHKNHIHKNPKDHSDDGKNILAAILQITLIDFIFSFDSVITAVAMTNNIPIMVAAIAIAMIIMLFSSEKISGFLAEYPSLKILALAFIFMVGAILLADGFNLHISKTYLYFSLFFTLTIEILNIVARKKR